MNPSAVFYALLRPGLAHPEFLVIGDLGQHGMHVLQIYLHPKDMGKVIGRGGATIDALNRLADFIGGATQTPIRIQVPEPEPVPVKNNSYFPRRWTVDWAVEGVQAYLTAAKTGCRASVVNRGDHAVIAVAPALPHPDMVECLDRWMGAVGNQGKLKLNLDVAFA